jgi:hypothetical protein
VLSDQEKQELREMAASEALREEFRALRKNSQEIERRITVDELARWLTAINRICPGDPQRRNLLPNADFRL